MNAPETTVRGGGLAAAVVRLTGLWILAGALGKLFLGTPKLLPPVVIELVREHTDWRLTFAYQVVIAIEIVLAGLAFLKPRFAWPLLLATMAFFDWILTQTIAGGEESCGCFGGSIKVSPYFMLAVDSVFLLGLLVTMPWKRIRKPGAPWWTMLVVVAIAVLAPWLKINAGGGGASTDTRPVVVVQPPTTPPGTTRPEGDGGEPTDVGTPGVEPGAGASTGTGTGTTGTELPESGAPIDVATPATSSDVVVDVDWVEFDPEDWKDQLVFDVGDLTRYLGPDQAALLPVDGRVVLWRQSCDHCAEHLSEMAQNDTRDAQIVLVQIRDDLTLGESVTLKPEGPHVTELQYPEGLEFILQTPWELVVEGGMITQVIGPE